MGKESRVKKGINFTEENFDVLEYLKEQGNASRYIIDLIRRDMEGSTSKQLEEINEKLDRIEKMLKTGGFKFAEDSKELKGEIKNKLIKSIKIMVEDDSDGE